MTVLPTQSMKKRQVFRGPGKPIAVVAKALVGLYATPSICCEEYRRRKRPAVQFQLRFE